MRAGEVADAELAANASQLKASVWPYSVAELYLGKRTPSATLDSAMNASERCEAHFYIGQWYILNGLVINAKEALKIAVETCPSDFYEYTGAVAELKRLQH